VDGGLASRAGAPASRVGRPAWPGRRWGRPAAMPRGAEAARGGAELDVASKGGAHSNDDWRRPGVASRGGGGQAAIARRAAAVAQRALAVAAWRPLARSENYSK
jgi:hypothetical protein